MMLTLGSQWFARWHAVQQAKETEGIRILERIRQKFIGEALVTHRSSESEQRSGTNRREANIGGRRVRPTMIHRRTYFDSGGESIEQHAPRFLLEHGK